MFGAQDNFLRPVQGFCTQYTFFWSAVKNPANLFTVVVGGGAGGVSLLVQHAAVKKYCNGKENLVRQNNLAYLESLLSFTVQSWQKIDLIVK